MPNVVIYTKGYCPYCHKAKDLLTKRGAKFQEIDVTDDAAGWDEMAKRSGRDTVPQIWIGDRHVGGCDDLHALDSKGELEKLLKG